MFGKRLFSYNFVIKILGDLIYFYPSPINLSYFWNFGSISAVILSLQLFSGIFLAMHYVSDVSLAFNSVEHIMRDVNSGWLLRYMHANGASMFFFIVYLHIARSFFFGSFLFPREFLWISGVFIFLFMILTAFLGYVLPWGQMSFWAATVITNLASAVPFVGDSIVFWLWGGFSVDNPTLNRFFSLHYLFPFLIVVLVFFHIIFLHEHGSNNPLGVVSINNNVMLNPYFILKDFFGFFFFFIIFFFFLFFYPNFLGHTDNYIPANSLVTPTHIVPEWYFLPFYAILRSIPDKFFGVLSLLCSLLILVLVPFFFDKYYLNRSFIYSNVYRVLIFVFFSFYLILGWLGGKSIEEPFYQIGQMTSVFYFLFILLLLIFSFFNF